MKSNDILNSMEHIDDKLITEADAPIRSNKIKRIRWAAVAAACLCLIFCGGVLLYQGGFQHVSDTSSPIFVKNDALDATPDMSLEIINSALEWGTMGFEGYVVKNISELDTENPWTEEAVLEKLPVYRNLSYSQTGYSIYFDNDTLLTMAERTAEALNVKIKEKVFHDNTYESDALKAKEKQLEDIAKEQDLTLEKSEVDWTGTYCLEAKATNGVSISVYGNGEIRISFDENSLSKKYSLSYAEENESAAVKNTEKFIKKFKGLLQMENPTVNTYMHRSYSGDPNREYEVFDKSGDLLQQILNYNFRITMVGENVIWIRDILSAAEPIGSYPIITAEQAKEMLINGSYITSVTSDFSGYDSEIPEEAVQKVELVYRTTSLDATYMPYYRFYVELSDEKTDTADGLKHYGAYYVPAVSGEYLSDFPAWNGEF